MSKDSKSLEFLTQALAKRFQNPGQAYLRYNVVWKPEEWMLWKYRPREAGGMDAQVQKKFAERPARAWEFERDGYAPSGSPVKMSPSVGSWRWAGCTYTHAQRACLATNLAGVPPGLLICRA